jgi:hypothetical protein
MKHLYPKGLLGSLLVSSAMFVGTPAYAVVNVCTGNNCVATSENVLVNAASNVSTVTGTTQTTNLTVLFTSATDPLLNGSANGQADISSADGLLNGLTFSLADNATFASATFNLFPLPGNVANEATSVILSYFDPLLGVYGSQSISTNGQNFLGISGNAGERFTSVTFIGNPATTGIQDLRQLRLGGAAAAVTPSVPEPSTWAMMLFGFAAVGTAMRRRRRSTSPRVSFA